MNSLRELYHYRIRQPKFKEIFLVRSILTTSIYIAAKSLNFFNVHLPIITNNDSEGSGESFKINNCVFSSETSLTVSTQLHEEACVSSLGRVFSFSPIFRAENSQTFRHLTEFWMVELELPGVFSLITLVQEAEAFLKQIAKDIQTLLLTSPIKNKGLEKRINFLLSAHYFQLSIEECILFLKCFSGQQVRNYDLSPENEKFLTAELNSPVFIYNFPLLAKPFYMFSDRNITKSFDLILPKVGETIGGGIREQNDGKLEKNLKEKRISSKGLGWYSEIKKNGASYSGGFGLGFERLLMFIMDIDNIRDSIFAPRYPGIVYL
jgi:asparaginyl-tRNA synthetase